MLSGYADEHVWSALVEGLRRRGMDVVTVQERQGEGTDDPDVLAEALREERILMTNDHDFLALASRSAASGEAFAPIFYWPQQRRRVGDLVRSIIREATRNTYEEALSKVFYI